MTTAVGMGRAWPRLALLFTPIFLLLPASAEGQLPLEAWIRPTVSVPIGDFATREEGVAARTSIGFDAGASVSLGALIIYGEYQETEFGCGECAEGGLEEHVLDRGWGGGVIVPLLPRMKGVQARGRIGVIGHHLAFRLDGETAFSDPALGWSVGISAEARPFRALRIEPAVLLRSYDARFGFAVDVPDRKTSTSYLSFGLGVGLGF